MNEGDRRLRAWHRSPLGALLQQIEQRVVTEALEDVFGLQLLQIGAWGEPGRLIEAARTQRRALISSSPGSHAQVCARPAELAVASEAIDAVVLPHTLEFERDPYAVLREVERILIAEGLLMILGFRPLGAWGLRHRLAAESFPPGLARLISERRLRDWLALLGFEIVAARGYLHRLPVSPGRGAGTATRSDGDGHWIVPSGAYLLKARKRVYAVTPFRPRWRERVAPIGGLVEPTTRSRS